MKLPKRFSEGRGSCCYTNYILVRVYPETVLFYAITHTLSLITGRWLIEREMFHLEKSEYWKRKFKIS